MGFDIHITRAADWSNNAGQQIRASEWRAVVREDPDLIEDPAHGACAVLWRGMNDGEEGWFDWSDGNVYTTDPSPRALRKMLEIAARLGARVQGDRGERYVRDGDRVVRSPG